MTPYSPTWFEITLPRILEGQRPPRACPPWPPSALHWHFLIRIQVSTRWRRRRKRPVFRPRSRRMARFAQAPFYFAQDLNSSGMRLAANCGHRCSSRHQLSTGVAPGVGMQAAMPLLWAINSSSFPGLMPPFPPQTAPGDRLGAKKKKKWASPGHISAFFNRHRLRANPSKPPRFDGGFFFFHVVQKKIGVRPSRQSCFSAPGRVETPRLEKNESNGCLFARRQPLRRWTARKKFISAAGPGKRVRKENLAKP